jgi:hypothetical protein
MTFDEVNELGNTLPLRVTFVAGHHKGPPTNHLGWYGDSAVLDIRIHLKHRLF